MSVLPQFLIDTQTTKLWYKSGNGESSKVNEKQNKIFENVVPDFSDSMRVFFW